MKYATITYGGEVFTVYIHKGTPFAVAPSGEAWDVQVDEDGKLYLDAPRVGGSDKSLF